MKKDYVITEELVLVDLRNLIESYDSLPTERTDEEIKEAYPHVIYAMRMGNLNLSEDKPKFELFHPIKNEDGDVEYSELKIKNRIPTSDMEKLTKGINMKTELLKMNNQLLSYIGGVPKAILDKMHKTDVMVITELMSIFL